MGAEAVVSAIDEAIDDPTIDALILHLESGGGSAVASQVIGSALARARDEDLLTIVTMGETAASGAYWVASYADYILAQPSTLTGSIGVVSGKVSFDELASELGIETDSLTRGDNADMWSLAQPFTDAQLDRLETITSSLYDRFLDRVAEGRDLSRDSVEALAEGRVWTGSQAVENGLADALGGVDEALTLVRSSLDLDPEDEIQIVHFPETPDLLDELLDMFNFNGMPWMENRTQANAVPAALDLLGLDVGHYWPLLIYPQANTLHMPPVRIR